ncbi:MAG: DUF2007 domain-containing protein [Dehalococcoidia bacterium]
MHVAALHIAVIASGPPPQLWAGLLMAGFVALSVFVLALARIAVREPSPGERKPTARTKETKRSDGWAVLRFAPDQLTAEMWIALLRDVGMPATIKPSDAVSFLGTSALGCRVLVPSERLEEAQELLAQRFGDDEPSAKG